MSVFRCVQPSLSTSQTLQLTRHSTEQLTKCAWTITDAMLCLPTTPEHASPEFPDQAARTAVTHHSAIWTYIGLATVSV